MERCSRSVRTNSLISAVGATSGCAVQYDGILLSAISSHTHDATESLQMEKAMMATSIVLVAKRVRRCAARCPLTTLKALHNRKHQRTRRALR